LVDAQTIGVLVTAASVTVAAIYYIFTLRINMRTQKLALKAQQQNLETRQTQLLMGIFDMMMNKEMMDSYTNLMNMEWVDYEDWSKKTKSGLVSSDISLVWRYLECIGFIVKSKLLDAEKFYGINGDTVIKVWDKFSGIIET
jgi:hypothetical protein